MLPPYPAVDHWFVYLTEFRDYGAQSPRLESLRESRSIPNREVFYFIRNMCVVCCAHEHGGLCVLYLGTRCYAVLDGLGAVFDVDGHRALDLVHPRAHVCSHIYIYVIFNCSLVCTVPEPYHN